MPEIPVTQWLKPEDIKNEDKLLFTNPGEIKTIPGTDEKKSDPKLEIGVRLVNGKEKVWTMNATSMRAVAKSYGENSDNWVNKTVIVFKTNMMVGKNEKTVIFARVPVVVAQAQPPATG